MQRNGLGWVVMDGLHSAHRTVHAHAGTEWKRKPSVHATSRNEWMRDVSDQLALAYGFAGWLRVRLVWYDMTFFSLTVRIVSTASGLDPCMHASLFLVYIYVQLALPGAWSLLHWFHACIQLEASDWSSTPDRSACMRWIAAASFYRSRVRAA